MRKKLLALIGVVMLLCVLTTVVLAGKSGSISQQQVVTLLQKQGESGDYYLEGLSFELVNLDDDDDLEIVAQIDGAVHLGEFFIFKKDL